jgi:hypothetical protein
MRTTLTLDPDVEVLLQRAMREQGVPFKRVVNDALRKGLCAAPAPPSQPFKQAVFDLGPPLIDVPNFNRLADELEDLEFIEKMRRQALPG